MSFYNDGTKLLFKKEWAAAQQQFEAALAINDKFAEAHNNLAYVLRKQGRENYAKSLEHYNHAIKLKPKLAEAYMYRGALHALNGQADLARADYDRLVKMKSKLAPHLKKVMDTGHEEEPEQFYGVAKKQK
jgi:tetratricopeptide (TPR) repeat protein